MLLRMLRFSIINLLYPPACLLCHRRAHTPGTVFCDACEGAMPPCLPPVCERCGLSVAGAYDAQPQCRRCQARPPAFAQARAPFLYLDGVREAVHAFKYRGHPRIGRWFAARMAQTASDTLPLARVTRIVPVPSHWLKARLRGASPAASLARAVARQLAVPYDARLLAKTRWTSTQTRLTPPQRFRNVRGAFRARRRLDQDDAVLLIDDVLTSGATADACAQALRAAGAQAVFVLTISRALSENLKH